MYLPLSQPIRTTLDKITLLIKSHLSRRQAAKITILLLSIIILYLFFRNWTYVTYGTRPLWETPDEPLEVIPHYHSSEVPMEKLCKLHGWSKRDSSSPNRIIDAILFSVELDLLEIRMRELLPVVDLFLIVESNYTFTGQPKPLVFAENRARFQFAEEKIRYNFHPLRPLAPGEDPFKLEKELRIGMGKLLAGVEGDQVDFSYGDTVIMADADEIPSREAISLLKWCDGVPETLHFRMRNYIYSFDFMVDDEHWRAKATRYVPGKNFSYGHVRKSDVILSDAGWHCSFCFPKIEDFVFKMTGYSHADRVRHKGLLDRNRIQKVICEGSDIFDMLPEAKTYRELLWKWGPTKPTKSLINVPRHLIQGATEGRFKYLLPGGCVREE
ncbi:hypothetical protein HDU76_000637 [Blyttiomyces sp. JEL0837]|nr:hypothetical protein HDU76_000637 [Blyttiomyces sp. JEL0837]